ncbi:MAG TPA: amino acid adenylation domain-containing protein, partial [Longimicrobium sp.]|nr:amino acid adenylation domain-containing protein [Longimicrobium sp.]
RLREGGHVLVTAVHHIVFDGWSGGVLLSELAALYSAFARGEPSPLAPLPVQYADYTVWQRDWLRGEVLEAHLAYWRGRLADAAPLELPTDRPRAAVQAHRGAVHRFALPAGLATSLGALARREGVTPFILLLAAFQAVLARWSGQDDVVVGTPIANRTRREVEGVVGFFANTLALRADLGGDPTFRELLKRVRETTLDAYAHQDLPFETLVEELRVERDLSRSPLAQVMFAFQASTTPFALPGMEIAPYRLEVDSAKLDLLLTMYESADGLGGALEYDRDLFDPSTAGRIADSLRVLLEAVAADPGRHVSRLPIVEEAERARLLAEWSDGGEAPASVPLHAPFEEWAAATPHATALDVDGDTISYAELDTRANRVAHALRAAGVGPDVVVGVCMERSPEMVVSILGILKAGGAWLPLDPALPADRLAFMLEDARPRAIVTRGAASLPPTDAAILLVEAVMQDGGIATAPAGVAPAPDSLAYVLYTSGSTGRPKGVMVSHHGAATHMAWMREAFAADASESVLFKTPFTFDASIWELFLPLWVGGRVVIARPGGHQDPAYLVDTVFRRRVTTLQLVPSMLQLLAGQPGLERCRALRRLCCGGEPYPAALARTVAARLPSTELVNLYGPTETSIEVAWWRTRGDEAAAQVPIGRPIAGTRLYLLDGALGPVPAGIAGEVYVAGAALGRGYVGRAALTAAAFLPNPFSPEPGARMYRVGDRARWRADGALEFLGRDDDQVKIRGFRIEPGEVEAALRESPLVAEAVVVARGGGADQRLVGYVVAAGGGTPDAADLRESVRRRLPDYMVPSAFVVLDAFPRTPGGKVDRRALPAPGATPAEGDGYVAPRTPVEELLAGIWAEVLGVARLGVHDDFFAVGGHSLRAMRVASRVEEALGVSLPLRAVFETPTVAGVAATVEEMRRARSHPSAPPIRAGAAGSGPAPLSFAQQRLWFLERMEPGSAAYIIPSALRLSGALDVPALQGSLGELARRHEVLRSTFVVSGGEPFQVVGAAGEFTLPMDDLRPLMAAEREAELARRAAAEAWRPFDLERGPLFRARLFRTGDAEHVLVLTLHHAVSDGWSHGVLLRELSALYAALSRGEPSPLPELAVRYADYAAWQRGWLRGEVLDAQVAFWRARLESAPVLELPSDRPRPAVRAGRGALHRFRVEPELARGLRALARREGATPFILLLTAFQALISRWSGQDDVVVGTPVANRERHEVEGVVGLFANMLALRTDLAGDPPFSVLLKRVREATLDAYAHQNVPFEKLVEELRVRRDLSRTPLVQVVFAWHGEAAPPAAFPGVEVAPFRLEGESAKFDLLLAMSEAADGMSGAVEYDRDLFDPDTVERLTETLKVLLAGIVAAPGERLSRLPIL